MARPDTMTCKCGQTRAVPVHGAIPKLCLDCRNKQSKEDRRKRALAYSRREDIKERRRRREGRTRRYNRYGPRVHDGGGRGVEDQ